jgi:hypothetical protein
VQELAEQWKKAGERGEEEFPDLETKQLFFLI